MALARIKFQCKCNKTNLGDQLCLLGSHNGLGRWNVDQRVVLTTDAQVNTRRMGTGFVRVLILRLCVCLAGIAELPVVDDD